MTRPVHRFSLADLFACVFILGLMAAVLVPALGTGTEKSDLALCAGNLRRIWIGLEDYGEDNEGHLPNATVGRQETMAQRNIMYYLWPDYVPDNHTFHCPADNAYWVEASGRQSYSYWYEFGVPANDVRIHDPIADLFIWGLTIDFNDLGTAMIMHDGEPWISRDAYCFGVPEDYRRHFDSKVENCLYLDGHVATRHTHMPDASNYYVGPYSWKAR